MYHVSRFVNNIAKVILTIIAFIKSFKVGLLVSCFLLFDLTVSSYHALKKLKLRHEIVRNKYNQCVLMVKVILVI